MSVEKKLTKARAGLILDQPFFGSLIMRMEMREGPESGETMGTDGTQIVYNPKFVNSLNPMELTGVLCHEVMHVVLMHNLRRGNRDPQLWNIAGDYAINPILTDAGFTLTEDRLQDDKYRDMSADQIYNILKDRQQDQKNQQPQSGGSNPDPGGCGSVFDHPGNISESEKTKLEQDTKIAVQQAAKQAESMAGQLPGSLKRVVGEITDPVINWRELLRRFMQDSNAKNDYSWGRPNKRFVDMGIYLPSLKGEELKPVCLAIDTSGSIDKKQLQEFSGELTAILEEYESHIDVLYCDAVIQGVEQYNRDDLPLNLVPKGGGGTSFKPPFTWVDGSGKDIACMIYFTDMCCNSFPEEPPYPVLWIRTGNYGDVPPFGEVIDLK